MRISSLLEIVPVGMTETNLNLLSCRGELDPLIDGQATLPEGLQEVYPECQHKCPSVFRVHTCPYFPL
jgi:hypothetical protein